MKDVILGLMIPLAGTVLGSTMVIFVRQKIDDRTQKILLGFASGVMIAASIWSLLEPAINMAQSRGETGWFEASSGFMVGVIFLLILDHLIPHLHSEDNKKEGLPSNLKDSTMLMLAVTLHNIPEGMAVGVVFAGVLANNAMITYSSAIVLSIGIAIQNFPEGAIISMPLASKGVSRKKSFVMGCLSGIVEPIAGIITILITSTIEASLPFLLSFAAGAMIYVVVEELVPESQNGEHSDWATMAVAIGFVIMMSMDIALG